MNTPPANFRLLLCIRAFSLLELLVVMTIVAVLLALSFPAMQSVMGSRNLGDAGGIIVSQLQAARQAAITRNAPVQWQILKIPDARSGDPEAFRVTRSLIMQPGGREWKPFGRPEWLPRATWVDEEPARSPMLGVQTNASNLPPGLGSSNAVAAWVIFDGAGRASVDITGNWLTLVGRSNTNDFVTVQIEPVSGRVRTYRPGL